jgi:hypothetical protein
MSASQAAMLRAIDRNQRLASGGYRELEIGEIVMNCAEAYEGGLAWRIADRTLGALLRRGWLEMDGDFARLTDAGREALAAVDAGRGKR